MFEHTGSPEEKIPQQVFFFFGGGLLFWLTLYYSVDEMKSYRWKRKLDPAARAGRYRGHEYKQRYRGLDVKPCRRFVDNSIEVSRVLVRTRNPHVHYTIIDSSLFIKRMSACDLLNRPT